MLTGTQNLALAITASACATASVMAGGGIEQMTTVQVASGLDHTTGIVHAPGDFTRLYIMEKEGRIKVLNTKTGGVNGTSFLNITGIVGGGTSTNNEQGLLGLAFHPNWQSNNFFYIYYTNNSGNTVVAKYTATSKDLANASSADTILTFTQPFGNHNGGWMGFGPNDGYLYIGTGDGGGAGDTGNNAQNVNSLLGKMLRIDVDGDDFPSSAQDYAIPPSNPFIGQAPRDEIWAIGLRNPWRCSFDRATGDLFIGDVGQGAWEEISWQKATSTGGENYGWRCREGAHNFNFSGSCSSLTLVDPIQEYSHSFGSSITGGHVYRGCRIPTLTGTYFYADYNSSQIWSFTEFLGSVTNHQNRTSELNPAGLSLNQISSFGEDALGEMYIVDQGSGTSGQIFRIVAVNPTIKKEDLDCNGNVGFSDILTVISEYGPCDGCLSDVNGDGDVGFADILLIIAEWG